MKSMFTFAVRSLLFAMSMMVTTPVIYAKAPLPINFTPLGINRGLHDNATIQALIDKGIAERVQATASIEVYKSYHIEIVELPPSMKRAETTFFGEVTSTFNITTAGTWILTEVELKSVALNQLGTPIGSNIRILSARLVAGVWASQLTAGGPVEEFPQALRPFSRKALFMTTGLLRYAPGQPIIVWSSDVGQDMAQRFISSLFTSVFTVLVPEKYMLPIVGDFIVGGVVDKLTEMLLERFENHELRFGVGEEITETIVTDSPKLFETLGERVWTDPDGLLADCPDVFNNWERVENRILTAHRACLVDDTPVDSATCTQSLPRFALDVYRVSDFYKPASPSEMSPDEILSFISSPSTTNWELIGDASIESNRARAQDTANAGILVLAVRRADPTITSDLEKQFTKIAFILPGQMSNSVTWGGSVPNSATLAVASAAPVATYLNKSLSFAFSSGANVRLYARKY